MTAPDFTMPKSRKTKGDIIITEHDVGKTRDFLHRLTAFEFEKHRRKAFLYFKMNPKKLLSNTETLATQTRYKYRNRKD